MAWSVLARAGTRLPTFHRGLSLTPRLDRISPCPCSAMSPSASSQGRKVNSFTLHQGIHTSQKHRTSQPSLRDMALDRDLTARTRKSKITTYTWTSEMDTKIVDMRLEGYGWKEIGQAIEREPAICQKRYLKALDPSLRRDWTPEKIDLLNAMVASGKNWRVISNKLLTPYPVCREKWESLNQDLVRIVKSEKRKQQGVALSAKRKVRKGVDAKVAQPTRKRQRWCSHMEALMLNLMNRGYSWREIGKVFGMVPMACYVRYTQKLKPMLESGWKPLELNAFNTPYYLLPNRVPPPPGARYDTLGASAFPSTELGIVGEDYSYRIESPGRDRIWTQKQDETIINARENGDSFIRIGEILHIDAKLCYHRFYSTLDPDSHKEWTPDQEDRLRYFVEQGVSWSTIAATLGFHRVVCKERWRAISRHSSPQGTGRDSSNGKGDNGEEGHAETTGRMASTVGATASTDYQSHSDDLDDSDTSETEMNESTDDEDFDLIKEEYRYDGDLEDAEDEEGEEEDMNNDLLVSETYESENAADGWHFSTGRRSKRSEQRQGQAVQDIWDQESVLQELEKTWTTEQETALIQHVIKNGTRSWEDVSGVLNGVHTPEECRAYWKHLDMPVHRPSPLQHKWAPHREAHFWRLWLEYGSDFKVISAKMGASVHGNGQEGESETGVATLLTPKDCEEFFHEKVRLVQQKLPTQTPEASLQENQQGTDGNPKDPVSAEDALHAACVDLALLRSVPPVFKWDKEKSVKLQKLVRQRLRTRGVEVNWINWKWVARHVGGGATAQRCGVHWRSLRRFETAEAGWTEEEILLLEQGLREVGHRPVVQEDENPLGRIRSQADPSLGVSNAGIRAIQRFYLPHRHVDSIQRKYFLLSDKASNVTLEEYTAIMDAVEKHGEDQWDTIVEDLRSHPMGHSSSLRNEAAAGWTKAPCRRVWESSYKYHLKYTQWSPQEDKDLQDTVRHVGQQEWVSVSRFFPGKSAWQCRLRWCQLADPVAPAS